jgi:hypothetical protein
MHDSDQASSLVAVNAAMANAVMKNTALNVFMEPILIISITEARSFLSFFCADSQGTRKRFGRWLISSTGERRARRWSTQILT